MTLYNYISEINLKQWDDLLNHSATANFFQSKQCYDFYDGLSFVEAFAFGVSEDDVLKGVIAGYIQKDGGKVKQFFSRRAIVNGGPLLADDISEGAVEELLKECARVLKDKAIYIEFRNFNDYSRYKGAILRSGFRYEAHYNFHIDTSSTEVVESNLGKSRKRDIRTSLRDGAEVVENPSIEEVTEYYELLSHLYKTKVKTPLFPFEFFEKLYNESFSKFLLIRYNGKIIGGTVCVCMKDNTVYEWFACGEDGVYKNIYPSTLATYSGISYAAKNGYKRFDMMGAGKPDEAYGVRDFKMKFGGKLVEYGRYLHVNNRILYSLGKMGIKITKLL